MSHKAIFFGAIGVLAETSELQRTAYNLAFRQSGLEWQWDADTYRALLQRPGGVRRLIEYAEGTGDWLDATAVHARKVANFRHAAAKGLTLRPGVAGVIQAAMDQDVRLAWVTTTGQATLDLMFEGLAPDLRRDVFEFVGHRCMVDAGKPAPDIYLHALGAMGLAASEVLAIEDTPESAEAALAAGIECIGFPGEAAHGRPFPAGVQVVEDLGAAGFGIRQVA